MARPSHHFVLILGKAGFKVGVLRSDGTQEMGYGRRRVGAGGRHTGREERKVKCHPPTGL